MEHDGTVNDELIAEQMQLAEVETSNHEGEESKKSDDTMNEDEQGEEEEETADEEVLFLAPEMIHEIADKQGFGDMANDLVQTLLTTSNPTQMDTVLQNIKDILALESKKEKLVKSAKARLEKIYRDYRKSHAPKGESIKSVNRSNTYNIEVRFGEHVIHLNLMGKHTFTLRERLRLLNPDLFSNDSDLKKKLEFYVVGKEWSFLLGSCVKVAKVLRPTCLTPQQASPHAAHAARPSSLAQRHNCKESKKLGLEQSRNSRYNRYVTQQPAPRRNIWEPMWLGILFPTLASCQGKGWSIKRRKKATTQPSTIQKSFTIILE